MLKFHYIYKTTCLINGKIYVGHHSSDDPNDSYLGSNKQLKQDILKFKRINFTKEILEYCELNNLQEKEVYWQCLLDCTNPEIGYNLRNSGAGGLPDELSYLKGKTGELNGFYGKTHSDETNKINREFHTNNIATQETKDKMSLKASGENNAFFNCTHTQISKDKMSIGQLNRPFIKCPHCLMESRSSANMKRYHFDNCKFRPK